ncbi:MAG: hypothetical protein WAM85_00305 [Terracidiphilus sp.]
MHFRFVAVFLIASICSAQTPVPTSPNAAGSSAPQPASASGTITVTTGTTVPLTLVTPIKSKSTHPGDAVRAVVAFPVTVGTQVAIPAGAYVEGVVNAVTVRDKQTRMPSVQIHFTRLLFANGYSVPLDAVNTQAMMIEPEMFSQAAYQLADSRDGAPYLGEGFGAPGQTTPTLPPLPQVGPNPAVVTGAVLGGGVGILVLSLVLAHHHGTADFVLFDNGWQCQMVLSSSLTLDAARVAATVQ